MKFLKTYVLLFSILMSQFAFGAANKNETQKDDEKKTDEKNWGFAPLALPFHSPETKWGVGGTVIYYNNPDPGNPASKLDEIQIYGAFTQNMQMAAGIKTDRFYSGDDYKLSGQLEADKWPDSFWGIGPGTREDMEEEYTDSTFYVTASFMKKINNMFYIGPLYRYRHINMVETDKGGLLAGDTIEGHKGAVTTGPGIHLNWDERDSIYYPLKGFLFEIICSAYRKELGGEFNYLKFEANHRHFIQIYGDHVFALQGKVQFSKGTVPFQNMYRMGGQDIMRGVYRGMYRDNNHIAGQAEYRFPLIWRFGGALYGSMAEVAPSIDEFNVDNIVYAWGTGLRFTADTKEHINFRLDFGFDEDLGPSIYLTAKEAL